MGIHGTRGGLRQSPGQAHSLRCVGGSGFSSTFSCGWIGDVTHSARTRPDAGSSSTTSYRTKSNHPFHDSLRNSRPKDRRSVKSRLGPFKDVKTAMTVFDFHIAETRLFSSPNVIVLPIRLILSPRSGLDVFLPHIDDTAAILSVNLRREWFFDFDCSRLVHAPHKRFIFLPRISRLHLFLVRQIVARLISGVIPSFALTDSIASAAVSFAFDI
jgi:hypothetical protein